MLPSTLWVPPRAGINAVHLIFPWPEHRAWHIVSTPLNGMVEILYLTEPSLQPCGLGCWGTMVPPISEKWRLRHTEAKWRVPGTQRWVGATALMHVSWPLVQRAAPAAALPDRPRMPRAEEPWQRGAEARTPGTLELAAVLKHLSTIPPLPGAKSKFLITGLRASHNLPQAHLCSFILYSSLSHAPAPTTPAYSPFSGLSWLFRTLHRVPKLCPCHWSCPHDQGNWMER